MDQEKYARRKAFFTLPYPMNLLLTINEDVFAERPIAVEDISQDTFDGLFYVLKMLSDREQEMVRLRFEEGLTLTKIGEAFGVSLERARYIIHDAMRKIRRPAMFAYLKYGLQGNTARLQQMAEKKRNKREGELINLNTASLEEMSEQLGNRAAAGIYEYRIVFGGFQDVDELQRARGVGVKTYERLKDKVCV
jgi:competence ComEA-like helix-hairpin-helix protein